LACPECHSNNIDHGTRVIGYLKRISAFSSGRQKEHALRHYHRVAS
jgi:ribonucleoside-triphosphate reductase